MRKLAVTPRMLAASAVLLALLVVASAANLLATYEAFRAGQAARQRQAQLSQKRLCTTLGRLASVTPPAGYAQGNPSRAYLQAEHAILLQLSPDIGCPAR